MKEAYSWRTGGAKLETSFQSFKEIWSSNRTIKVHKIGKARFNGSFYLVDVALDSLDVFKGKEQRAIYHGVLTLSQPSYGDWDDVRYHEFKVLRTEPMPLPAIASPKKKDPESRFIADELIKLKKLLDEGVLTQEEFDKQKAKLLSR